MAPGTVITIAVGSANGDEGDFSITVNETNAGVPANDLCAGAIPVNFTANCDFVTVTGTTLNACPEAFAGACSLDNFPTVWYSATVPAGGVGFGFSALTGSPSINIFSGACPTPASQGSCITAATDVTNLTPGTYLIAVRNTDPGASFGFDIKTIVPPANDLCASATTLSDNVAVNGTTSCATPFSVSYCGLNTTSSHTVFYRYTVPATNTTNTNLDFTITPNTATTGTAASNDINVGLFTDCAGTIYPASVEAPGNLCAALGASISLNCVAPGTVLTIAVGSANGDEGDFSINVNETNTGIPVNDLCASPTPINFTSNCDDVTVSGTTINACPEIFTGSPCGLENFPTVWYTVTLPPGGVGFGFSNFSGGPNINILNTTCATPTSFGSCITAPVDITNLSPGTYHIAVRSTAAGTAFGFNIKTIVPPANNLCSNAVTLSDNVPVNGTTSCAIPFTTSFCSLSTTTSHTVFYRYTVPASNTTNTNLEFTITPNSATTGTAAANDINIGLFTDCAGTVFPATVTTGSLCTALGNNVKIECVAPGTVLFIAVGSSNGDEGDFSIKVDENNTGIPANDLCSAPTPVNFTNNCIYQTVTGTTLSACPESFSGGCGLNTFPTVWYQVVLPANGIGFGFQNLSAGLNIAIFNNACPPTTQYGTSCVTSTMDVTGLTPGTYLIAVRNTDPGSAVSFEIKTILFLPNDNPCVAGFIATNLSNGSPLSNESNVCATVDNTCSGPVSNSLWYNFTLNAPNDKITINVTGLTSPSIGIYDQANPCNQTPLNQECNGDGMVEFNCLPPGTYKIFVGTSAADAGTFSITATQGTNAGVPNDLCSMATVLPGQPYPLCVNIPGFTSTNLNACPETGLASVGACNFNTEETSWYTFTAPGNPGQMPTMNFTYTSYTGTGTPFMGLFTGGCGGLTAVTNTCLSGLNTVFTMGPLTPGQTYYIALSSFGDTGGNSVFTIKFNIGPPNDDKCNTASGYDLGSGGTLTNQTNLCAGGDYIISDCPPADSENSGWYTFTVNPGSYGVNIFIDGIATNSTPIQGDVAVAYIWMVVILT
ncbi:MAG: hypothetical protein IPN89_09095 [Saprospiraceae bacterium]|nr:hypothetical protein [Saprospiraceae bacterium]